MSYISDCFAVSPSNSDDGIETYGSELQQDGCSFSLADTDDSLHQTDLTTTSLMEERDSPPPAPLVPTSTTEYSHSNILFTTSNLAQHDHYLDDNTFYVDDKEDQRLFEEQIENLRLALGSMNIEVPDYALHEMARHYNGMESLERLLTEYEDSVSQWMIRDNYYAQDSAGDHPAHDALGEELQGWEES